MSTYHKINKIKVSTTKTDNAAVSKFKNDHEIYENSGPVKCNNKSSSTLQFSEYL